MHLILKNPSTGQIEGMLCIERSVRTCYILTAEIGQLDSLVRIAQAQKAPEVRLVIPRDAMSELLPLGWNEAVDLVVMTKETHDK